MPAVFYVFWTRLTTPQKRMHPFLVAVLFIVCGSLLLAAGKFTANAAFIAYGVIGVAAGGAVLVARLKPAKRATTSS